MAKRRRADVKTTILCATKFWAYAPRMGTMRRHVRTVVRKQGFTTSEIVRAERELVREGKLSPASSGSLRLISLTDKGQATKCGSVKLAPWTNDEYPGASLAGRRRRRR